MKKLLLFLTIFISSPATALSAVSSATLSVAENTSGSILLQVQQHGEAWYVDPVSKKRTYMQDGAAAYELMRSFGLGITDADVEKIPAETVETIKDKVSICSTNTFARNLSGRILLQVQQHGEAWYIYPKNCRKIYLKNGEIAYDVMRFLGLGITDADLLQIPVQGEASENPVPVIETSENWSYEQKTISTSRGEFKTDLVMMKRDKVQMIVDVAELDNNPNLENCEHACDQKPLDWYISKNNAFAGIHGSYFCPPDYAPCAGKSGEFLVPLIDAQTPRIINDQKTVFHFGPMLVQDTEQGLHYYHRTKDFGSIDAFEASTGKKIVSAISNYPSLVEDGNIVVFDEPTDKNQETARSTRGGIGYDNDYIYLAIVHNATVYDSAAVFEEIGTLYALNLDGGGSSTLYVEGEYKVGPARLLPNAIVFKEIQ